VDIRSYQPGDEEAQLLVYNTAAAALPRFKPATSLEVQRRVRGRDFDPGTRFYAEVNGRVVAYCVCHTNGRVSYPWALPGAEPAQEPLLARALALLRQHQVTRAFAAYRSDWPTINDFFVQHGFTLAREMVNFVVHFSDMPTPAANAGNLFTPLRPDDMPALLALAPGVLRLRTPQALQKYLLENPYFPPQALFVLRSRSDNSPLAVGIIVDDPGYADPETLDSNMPCFRLGAFGTEGLQTKRVRGLFSFLARLDKSIHSVGMDLLGHAAYRLHQADDLGSFAAQVASDVPLLLSFYQRTFRRQGSFPVYERDLTLAPVGLSAAGKPAG
jgi:hypothetical protein